MVIKFLQAPLVALIRLFLNNISIPLGLIINDLLGFKWFNFKESLLTYYPEYLILFTTPQFDIQTAADIVPAWMGEQILAHKNALMGANNEITINPEDLLKIDQQFGGVIPNNSTLKQALNKLTNESVAKRMESDFVR